VGNECRGGGEGEGRRRSVIHSGRLVNKTFIDISCGEKE